MSDPDTRSAFEGQQEKLPVEARQQNHEAKSKDNEIGKGLESLAPAYLFFASLVREFGPFGALIIIVTGAFLVFGSKEQWQEFFDIYLLFKHVDDRPEAYIFMAVVLLIMIMVTINYSKRRTRIDMIKKLAKKLDEVKT